MEGPRLRQKMGEQAADARALKLYKDEMGYLYDLKIKEDEVKAKAAIAAHPPTARTWSVQHERPRRSHHRAGLHGLQRHAY